MSVSDDKIEMAENSNSLIARATQIMVVIIGLGLISMISSMLVSESLSGDAEKINRAGQLRMLAMKVSRAAVLDEHSTLTTDTKLIPSENDFNVAFLHLFDGGLIDELDQAELRIQYQKVDLFWQKLKSNGLTSNESNLKNLISKTDEYDHFVSEIDALVLLIQQKSEEKIGLLRAIHGISLLSVIIVAFVVLSRINKNIVSPLKRLIIVASAAGKGDFSLRSDYQEQNELGLLSQTINNMSEELKLTHDELEYRVKTKTSALTRSNQTLAVLYDTSKKLSEGNLQKFEKTILMRLQKHLGFGHILLTLTETNEKSIINLGTGTVISHNICSNQIKIPLCKRTKNFGYLTWDFPLEKQVEDWQLSLIETIADMFALARAHQQERLAENRLVIIEERSVIARELHDSLAQSLAYLKIQVALLTKKLDKQLSRERIDSTVEDIRQGLNRAYLQLRELLTTFRLKLDDPSIEHALKGTVAEFSSKSGHPIELDFNLYNKSLSANQEIHVIQIIREALSNIHRHAKAKKAEVSVLYKNKGFIVTITDDGVGMTKEHQLEGHFGLGIMQERAKSLNSKISIESTPSEGTSIQVKF